MWQRFASLPIRNAGTLGGNVANGSPIGDSMPWLIALGAEVVLRGAAGERVLALEDFYLGYQKKDLQAGEFVQARARAAAARRRALPHLQAGQALRPGHLGRVRGVRVHARRRRRGATRASPSAAWPPRRSAPPRPKPLLTRPALDRSSAAARRWRRWRRTTRRCRDMRASSELPHEGGAEPAAPLLVRDAPRCAAGRRRRQRVRRARVRRTRMNDAGAPVLQGRRMEPRSACRAPHESAALHVLGQATYTDDIPEVQGTLHARAGPVSQAARAASSSIDLAPVRASRGVVAVLHGRRHPRHQRLRPDHPRRPDLRRRPGACTSASRCSSWSPTRTTTRAAPRAWPRSTTKNCRRS